MPKNHPNAQVPGHARTVIRYFRLSPRDDAQLARDIQRSGAASLSEYVRFRLFTGKRSAEVPAWEQFRDWRNEAIRLTAAIAGLPASRARDAAVRAAEEMFKTVSRWRNR
jgi:hypothetical protein